MKKKALRLLSTVLTAALLVTAVPAIPASAALSEVNSPAGVSSFQSSDHFDAELLRAWVVNDGEDLKIDYQTPLMTSQFNLSLYRVGANKGNLYLNILLEPELSISSDNMTQYGFLYYLNIERYNIPNGYYNLYIRRYASPEDAEARSYGSAGVLYKNMEIKVTNGKVKILRYKDVIDYNRSIQKIGEAYSLDKYLDNSLEDIRFVLRNPATNVYDTITEYKSAYFKTISDRITAGAASDYEKLRRIYEYTASNFYYDSVAFSTHSYQYANPYDNLYNFENGLSSANSVSGKVHTTCQGFSAIYLALARAQGIPTRFVYGHRLAVPSNDWLTENNIDVRDHWWAESFVNGRWIFVDPTVGTTNKYNKTTGAWTYHGLTNYTYFDASEDQVATSHVYMNIYPDYRYGKYLDNAYEVQTLTAFLDQMNAASSKTNGALLNPAYNAFDKETWGDGTKSHFMTDGRGNTAQIQWSSKGFEGEMNLSSFTKMTLLSAHHNKLTKVNLSGNSLLKNVYLNDNALESLNLADNPRLSYVRVQNNPMKDLTMYVNGSNRTFSAEGSGTFHFTYDKRYKNTSFSLYSKPDIGYKLQGVYSTGTGSRLSTKTTWHFTPKAVGYDIRFALDPDSFQYELAEGDSSHTKLPYVQAAAKRLAALGYYAPTGYTYVSGYDYGYTPLTAGEETTFTAALKEAVIKFQVMNDLPNDGIIDAETWSVLFSEAAASMAASDAEYQQILADYEVRIQQLRAAREELAAVSIQATSKAVKGAMKLSWTTTAQAADGSVTAYQPDGYELWKSTSKTNGYTLLKNCSGKAFKNTSNIQKGKRYYYKVRAYKIVGEKKLYSAWSNVTYKIAK